MLIDSLDSISLLASELVELILEQVVTLEHYLYVLKQLHDHCCFCFQEAIGLVSWYCFGAAAERTVYSLYC